MTEIKIGPPGYVLDPDTGEVLASQEQVAAMAVEYAAVVSAHDEALREARTIGKRRDALEDALRGVMPVESRADAGRWWVVMEPANRPAQRVDATACLKHREELLTLSLGRESTDFHPPTAADLRAAKARLIAAGLSLAELLPEPKAGPPAPVVVPKAAP